MSPSPLRLIGLICTAEALSMLSMAAFPALLPSFVAEWSLTKTEAGWINGIYFAGYLSAVPILVSLTDRTPARRIYMACMALSAAAGLGFAFFAEGFWTAMLFRGLSGIGLAGTYMPGLKLLNDHLERLRPGADHSRSTALYTSSFAIGLSASYVLSGYLAESFGWPTAFAVVGIGPIIALVLMAWRLPADPPMTEAKPDTHLLDFRPVFRCGPAMAYVLAYTLHNFELFAYRSWAVAYLVFAGTLHPEFGLAAIAPAVAAVSVLLGVPASILGNELSRAIGRHRAVTLIMLTSAVGAVVIGLAASWSPWLLITFMLIYGVMLAGESSSVTAGVIGAAPKGYRGATMAVHSCIGFSGSFAGPLVFGIVLDAADVTGVGGGTVESWSWAFAVSGLVVALGPVALFVLGRKRRDANG